MALYDLTGDVDAPTVRVLGNLAINLNNFRVVCDGQTVSLTFTEMELLRLFFQQPDKIITYQAIAEALWADSSASVLRHLHVLVHRLRSKLAASHPYAIETVRGRGYGLLLRPNVAAEEDT